MLTFNRKVDEGGAKVTKLNVDSSQIKTEVDRILIIHVNLQAVNNQIPSELLLQKQRFVGQEFQIKQ